MADRQAEPKIPPRQDKSQDFVFPFCFLFCINSKLIVTTQAQKKEGHFNQI
jgi:hypothetical protein